MKILAISDTHGNLPHIPECDLLIIGGDLFGTKRNNQRDEWHNRILPWMETSLAKHIVFIAGNHDWFFCDSSFIKDLSDKLTYLEDDFFLYSYGGEEVKIYGSPWVNQFNNWAFMLDEGGLAEKWVMIPDNLDILVTHGPPRYILDSGLGSISLLDEISIKKPKVHVFGHIHDCRGEVKGDTLHVNVASRSDRANCYYGFTELFKGTNQ